MYVYGYYSSRYLSTLIGYCTRAYLHPHTNPHPYTSHIKIPNNVNFVKIGFERL